MPQITTQELTNQYGKFVFEPLERGYGHTIGSALRRVLLNSIQGAAVAAVRVGKVFHEFAPIPGVKEDMTEFLLNCKNLAIQIDFDLLPPDEVTLKLNVKGPGRVTGADLECPEGVSITNPEVYIATISDSSVTLEAELYVNWGSGYTLPDKQERYKGVIGVITTGSQFTPVRKVNITVEPTRVGSRTDFDRLVLDVWTNGAVPPNDAVTQAAQILAKYFHMLFDLGKGTHDIEFGEEETDLAELANVPEIKIEEMDFSQRTFNCLRRAGLLTLRHLAAVTESDLTSIRGFGKKSLNEVRDKLGEHGLAIKPPKAGYRVELLDDEDDEDFD